jgi:hypothetical protein
MMGGGMGLGGGYERPVEETVINNYYDEPSTRGFENDRTEGEHHVHDMGDQGGAHFSDADSSTSGDDRSQNDQMAFDDSNNDDSSTLEDADNASGFDDDGGIGFDDGGGFGGDSGGDLV